MRLQVTDAVDIFVSVNSSANKLIGDSNDCKPTLYKNLQITNLAKHRAFSVQLGQRSLASPRGR